MKTRRSIRHRLLSLSPVLLCSLIAGCSSHATSREQVGEAESALVVRNTAYPLPLDSAGRVFSSFSVADLMLADSAARCASREGETLERVDSFYSSVVRFAGWPDVPGYLGDWAEARSNERWNGIVGPGGAVTPKALSFPKRDVSAYRLVGQVPNRDAPAFGGALYIAGQAMMQMEFDLCMAQSLNELSLSAAGAQLTPVEMLRHLNNLRVHAQKAAMEFGALAEIAASNDPRPADYEANYEGILPSGQVLYDFTHAEGNREVLATLGTDMAIAVNLHVTATERLAKLASRAHLARTAPIAISSDTGSESKLPWGEVLRRLLFGEDPVSAEGATVGLPGMYETSALPPALPFPPGTRFNRRVARLFELALRADALDVLEDELSNGSCAASASKSTAALYTAVEASLRAPECVPPRDVSAPDCQTKAEGLNLPELAKYEDFNLWKQERIAPSDATELLSLVCASGSSPTLPYNGTPERRTLSRPRLLGTPAKVLHFGRGGVLVTVKTDEEQARIEEYRKSTYAMAPTRFDAIPRFADKYNTSVEAMGMLGRFRTTDTGAVAAMSAVRATLALADTKRTAPSVSGFFDNARVALDVLRRELGPVTVVRRGLPSVFKFSSADGQFNLNGFSNFGGYAGGRCVSTTCEVLASRTGIPDDGRLVATTIPGIPSQFRADEVIVVSEADDPVMLCDVTQTSPSRFLEASCATPRAPAETLSTRNGNRVRRWTLQGQSEVLVASGPSPESAVPLVRVPAGPATTYLGTRVVRNKRASDYRASIGFAPDHQAISASRGGALEQLVMRTFAVDSSDWTRPAFGLVEPRSLLFPNEGQLLEGGLAATTRLLADARREAEAAEQRTRGAVTELDRQQSDLQAADDARERALEVNGSELETVLGARDATLPVSLQMGQWGFSLAADSLAQIVPLSTARSGEYLSVPYLNDASIAACPGEAFSGAPTEIAQRTIGCAEQLVERAGGTLRASLGAYVAATRSFFDTYANVSATTNAAKQREDAATLAWAAAQAIPVGTAGGLVPECSKSAFENAFRAGFGFGSVTQDPQFQAGDGSWSYWGSKYENKARSWSPGPLYQQQSLCDSAAARAGEAIQYRNAQAAAQHAQLLSVQKDRIVQVQAALSQANTAAAQVWQAANQVLSDLGRARTLRVQRDLDVRIATQRRATRLGFLQRFLSSDLETAYYAQERARRFAVAARRAIEARYLVDLSTFDVKGDILDKKPSEWADGIYGFDFGAIVNADGRSTNLAAVTQYVQRLEDFTRDYQKLRVASTRVATRRIAFPGPDASDAFASTPGTSARVPKPGANAWSFLCAGASTWSAHPLALGTGSTADAMCGGAPPQALRLRFSLDEWGRLAGSPPPANISTLFNARFARAMVTLTGDALDELATYAYDLVHLGPITLRDHSGFPLDFAIGPGRIVDGRAAFPKRLNLTEVNTPWGYQQLQGAIVSAEVSDRPLFGAYEIVLTLPDRVLPSAVNEVQLWVESSSWVKK